MRLEELFFSSPSVSVLWFFFCYSFFFSISIHERLHASPKIRDPRRSLGVPRPGENPVRVCQKLFFARWFFLVFVL